MPPWTGGGRTITCGPAGPHCAQNGVPGTHPGTSADALPEVVATYHLGGVDDFLVHVAVRDTVHLKELALEAFAARPEVTHMETALVFEHQVAALQLATTEESDTARAPRTRRRSTSHTKANRRTGRKEPA